MSNFNKCTMPRQASYNSLYVNPLTELKHHSSCSDGGSTTDAPAFGIGKCGNPVMSSDNKENTVPKKAKYSGYVDKENVVPNKGSAKLLPNLKSNLKDRVLKPSSLQLCMQINEPDLSLRSKIWDPIDSGNTNSANIWDNSDSEAAPASSWSTLPNRPLPPDVGRCTCVIVKEASPKGLRGGTLYALYTNEGQGRQNRKLALAYHKRHNGRSKFTVAQNTKGVLCSSDDSFVGSLTANLMGSKYHIWDQGSRPNTMTKHSKVLLAVVRFMPTIATWTGSHRTMKAWIPKHQSMQLKNTTQIQHISGLPKDWEENMDKAHQLFSKVPHYNNISKQYELDFRERGRAAGHKIQSSNGRQTIIQLGRVGKSQYIMDYRYPLTGYQAFCICLASIDSKLCCT
ncbi:hypothetical protein RJ639_037878, partial [Escallonia herrerae]